MCFLAGADGVAVALFFDATRASVADSVPARPFADSSAGAATASAGTVSAGCAAGGVAGVVEGVALGAEAVANAAGAVGGVAGFGFGAEAVFAVAAGAEGFLLAIGSLSLYHAKPMPPASNRVAAMVRMMSRSPTFLRSGL